MHSFFGYAMGIFYVITGINHFLVPSFYVKMIDFLPFPSFIVFITGIIEMALGVAICFPETRSQAASLLIFYLIAVFPANVNMALHPEKWDFMPISLYVRLFVQFLLIWWAYQYVS